MDIYRPPRELQLLKLDSTSGGTQPTAPHQKRQVEDLNLLHLDSEDDVKYSHPPSMTDGSSRTSSVYSTSDRHSAPLCKPLLAQESPEIAIFDFDGSWFARRDESNPQHFRTKSPSHYSQLTIHRRLKELLPAATSSNICSISKLCCSRSTLCSGDEATENSGTIMQLTQGTPNQDKVAQTLAVSGSNPGNEDVGILFGQAVSGSDLASSESDDYGDNDHDYDDDDSSGSNDYFETAIYKAAFPDLELAAHLISQMYSMLLLGSSKSILGKVSSWRERITMCPDATDSRITCTEKEPTTTRSSSILGVSNSKRGRHSSSSGDNVDDEQDGDDDDDDDDDDDENSRKRHKDRNLYDAITIPTQRLACPFNKMNPSKYCSQHNQGSKSREYRTCAGPGFLRIQLLKEHLKRIHYPVQCDRCYLIFDFKSNRRAAAVAELAKHRQLDEVCPKRPSSMKEGINDAEWTSLNEENQGKKGKAVAAQTPKSDVDKWKNIWLILFPHLPVPVTPWYDTTVMNVTTLSPSQGQRSYGKVHEEIIKFKLQSIRAARSEAELISLLLEVGGRAFEVWSATCRFNEALTSSISNSGSSNPLSSEPWEHILQDPAASLQQGCPQPPISSVFPNLDPVEDYAHDHIIGHRPSDLSSIFGNTGELFQNVSCSTGDIISSSQDTFPGPNSLGFSHEPGFPAFPAEMESQQWINQIDQVNGMGEIEHMQQMNLQGETLDPGVTSSQNPPDMAAQWDDDDYSLPTSSRFGRGGV